MSNKIKVIFCMPLLVLIFACDHSPNHQNYDNKENHAHDNNHEKKIKEKTQSDQNDDDGMTSTGKEFAVVRADKTEGIQLSETARINIGLKKGQYMPRYRRGYNYYLLPAQSLLFFENQTAVYVARNHWLRMIHVKILKKYKDSYLVQCRYFRSQDRLIVAGLALLRLTHLDAFGASGNGHSH